MAIKVTPDEVIKYNRLPKDTQDIDEYIEEAQQIIDDRLGTSFDITLITEGRKRYYYNAIKKQVLIQLMSSPHWDFMFNTNARIDSPISPENEKAKKKIEVQEGIDYFIFKLLEEMEDDGTSTDEIPEVIKMKGLTWVCLGGDPDYYPENNTKYTDGRYKTGDNDE